MNTKTTETQTSPRKEERSTAPAYLPRRLILARYGIGPAALRKLGVPAYRLGHKTVLFKAEELETALVRAKEVTL